MDVTLRYVCPCDAQGHSIITFALLHATGHRRDDQHPQATPAVIPACCKHQWIDWDTLIANLTLDSEITETVEQSGDDVGTRRHLAILASVVASISIHGTVALLETKMQRLIVDMTTLCALSGFKPDHVE